jgi:hypothetical protein
MNAGVFRKLNGADLDRLRSYSGPNRTTTSNNGPTLVEPGIHPTSAVVGAGYTKLFAQDDTRYHVHFHHADWLPSPPWYGVGKTHVLAPSPLVAQELQLPFRPPFTKVWSTGYGFLGLLKSVGAHRRDDYTLLVRSKLYALVVERPKQLPARWASSG